MANDKQRPLVLAITGASGAVYARRLLEVLLAAGRDVHLTISPAAVTVFREELDLQVSVTQFDLRQILPELGPLPQAPNPSGSPGQVMYHHFEDYMAPIASGSAFNDGMTICPCSGGTLSNIVHGTSGNLIHRAADVQLKERRRLILVPRETPLSIVQLENMRRACELGAVVLPASPGWYHGVKSLDDLIDFVVARILDQLGVEHQLMKRWGESS